MELWLNSCLDRIPRCRVAEARSFGLICTSDLTFVSQRVGRKPNILRLRKWYMVNTLGPLVEFTGIFKSVIKRPTKPEQRRQFITNIVKDILYEDFIGQIMKPLMLFWFIVEFGKIFDILMITRVDSVDVEYRMTLTGVNTESSSKFQIYLWILTYFQFWFISVSTWCLHH